MSLFDDEWLAVAAQLFVATSPLFLKHAIRGENHMLDALFFLLALYMLLEFSEGARTTIIPLGVAVGLATLTRFTSYVLLPVAVVLFLHQFDWRRAGLEALKLVGVVVVLNSPLYVVNVIDHGNPLHTWKFLNIGYAITPDSQAFLWKKQALYDGPVDLVTRHPRAFVSNYFNNLTTLNRFFGLRYGGPLAPLFPLGVLLGGLQLDRVRTLVLSLPSVALVGAICVAFVFPAAMLAIYVLLWLLAVWSVFWVRDRLPDWNTRYVEAVFVLVLAVLLVLNLVTTASLLGGFYAADDEFQEVREASETIMNIDSEVSNPQIMGDHGSIAYYSEGRFVMAPLRYDGTVTEWVCYEDVPEDVRQYVPNAPPTDVTQFDVDYLVFTESMASQLPQFSFLLNPNSDAVPSSFDPVYTGETVTAYRIHTECAR